MEFAARFDGVTLLPKQFAVDSDELAKAAKTAGDALRSAIKTARSNIQAFSKKALRKSWSMTNVQGGRVGEKYDPFERVGLYIPGGAAPLASTDSNDKVNDNTIGSAWFMRNFP